MSEVQNIVRVKFGSHLYGTNTPESDLDYKAIHIPSAEDILLQRVKPSIKTAGRLKGEGEKNTHADVDSESYSLQRFFELCEEGQTVAIDMLFAPEECCEGNFLWSFIQQNRHRLISKKSAAFVGYCRQQANKYGIKGSRVAAVKDVVEMFTAAAADLGPLARIGEIEYSRYASLLANEHTKVTEGGKEDGPKETYFECCNRKMPLGASIKTATEVYTRVYESYGDRARLAQTNEGVDWKALSHAVRVGQEAVELLNTGTVTLPLPNADFIKQVKRGDIPYETVAETIEALLVLVEIAAESSTLPDEPDRKFIDNFVKLVYNRKVQDAELFNGAINL